MASNKSLEYNSPLQVAVPSAAALKSNALVLIGPIAGVCNESDGDSTRPSTGRISIDTNGAFDLTVTAKTALSPSVSSAVNPGDKLYLDGGTLDSTTGITYGGTIDKNSGGSLIGIAVSKSGQTGPLLASGATGTVTVRLNQG